MNIVIIIFVFYCTTASILCTKYNKNKTDIKKSADEDYYLNYDYDLSNNNSVDVAFKLSDSLILPNPESIDSKYTIDVLPNIELPDDSLADTDLKDHDFIDNIMYVYYGSHNRNVGSYGPEIIIIGSVLSCAAQLLTIFCVMLKKSQKGEKVIKYMFFQVMGSFCVSNLIFMLGVYATRSSTKCLIISLILHFLHLLTAFWLFLYCFYIYKLFSNNGFIKLKHLKIKYLNITAYDISTVITLTSYCITPNSYESKRFCFISVQKGMLLNYMLPVSLLLILTTIYTLNGLRKINMELSKLEFNSSAESINVLRNEMEMLKEKRDEGVDEEVVSLRESKVCLKFLCIIQTGYDIVWFIVVLALENVNDGNGMSLIYAVTSCLLNWYIFIKRKCFMPIIYSTPEVTDDHAVQKDEETNVTNTSADVSRRGSSDSVPLLNSDSCTEMRELHLDHISTISN